MTYLYDLFLQNFLAPSALISAVAAVLSAWPAMLSSPHSRQDVITATLVAVLHDSLLTIPSSHAPSGADCAENEESATVGSWSGTTAGRWSGGGDLFKNAREVVTDHGIRHWGWSQSKFIQSGSSEQHLMLPAHILDLLARAKHRTQGADVELTGLALAIASLFCGRQWATDEVCTCMYVVCVCGPCTQSAAASSTTGTCY